MTLTQPYLIQRGRISKPLANPREATLSKSVHLDYMGSAEYEFGALPRSLRAIRSMSDEGSITVRKVESIRKEESPLRVFSGLSNVEFAEYEGYLHLLRQDKIRLKETPSFAENGYPSTLTRGTDFWWDIDNHVMWSFNKNYMNRLEDYLQNSFKVMER